MGNVVKMGKDFQAELVLEEIETHARADGLRCAHLRRDRNIKGVGKTDREAIKAALEIAYPDAQVELPPVLTRMGEKEKVH